MFPVYSIISLFLRKHAFRKQQKYSTWVFKKIIGGLLVNTWSLLWKHAFKAKNVPSACLKKINSHVYISTEFLNYL